MATLFHPKREVCKYVKSYNWKANKQDEFLARKVRKGNRQEEHIGKMCLGVD